MIAVYFIIAFVLAGLVYFVKKQTTAKAMIILFAFVQLCFTAYGFYATGKTELDYFTYDSLGMIFLSLLSVIFCASIYHGFRYFRTRITPRFYIYHAALIILITSISAAYLANDVTVVWVLVEATTLSVSVLIYHEKTRQALEATWKYIFLCSVGIAFAYFGILFLGLSSKGGIEDFSFETLSLLAQNTDPMYLKVAFVFMLIGYSTKMELFPMHTVGIDANSVSPSPVAALISTGLVNLGFLAIFRIYIAFSSSPIFGWMNNILILSGILSIVVAAGYMLKAQHNKRMLAYSTLENMGLVAIAIGLGGQGYYAAILLLILHSLTKASLFFQIGQVSRALKTFLISESGEYMKRNPAGAVVLILGLFAILAIPPSGIFISEFLIIKTMIAKEYWAVMIITFLLLCCVIYAMSTRFMHILFSKAKYEEKNFAASKVNARESITQYIFLAVVFFICFYQPQFLKDIINDSIAVLLK
ncbi:MAG: hypothetical protein A2W91_11930 [Bacteroidetes bacterium GWF2_38_335]|nr:MAG: hypothetical protein A2W91_11930 [Bacteroidetes bacterium GWF2_38_335]OFY76883.1 MAG: hypothetical protein A2281_00045 [Bacteroidetes bacterium RIFOXYA12_FULL_38_20]HBS86730.1 hypothetical protein [Bacteroidales bacterium]